MNSSMDNHDQHRQVAFMIIINGSVLYCCCAVQMIFQILILVVNEAVYAAYPWIEIIVRLVLLLASSVNASINPTRFNISSQIANTDMNLQLQCDAYSLHVIITTQTLCVLRVTQKDQK